MTSSAEVVMTLFTKIGTHYYGRRASAEVVMTRFTKIGTYYYGRRASAEVVMTRFTKIVRMTPSPFAAGHTWRVSQARGADRVLAMRFLVVDQYLMVHLAL